MSRSKRSKLLIVEEDDFCDGEVDLPYRNPNEIERYELSEALRLLQFFGDDSNLNAGLQSVVVDNFIMRLEYEALHHSQEDAVIGALLGTPYVNISRSASGEEIVEDGRAADGIWYGPPDGQAQNTGLSGVLVFREIDPWNFVSRSGLLIPNPWAAKPLPVTGFGVDELKVAGDAYERANGEPLSSLLELPDAWPEERSGEA